MKKIVVIVLAILMAVGVFAGCTSTPQQTADLAPTPTPEAGEEPAEEAVELPRFIVTLPGQLGDQSYNDTVKIGIDRAVASFGVHITYLEAASPADFEPNAIAAATGGYDLVIIVSGQQSQAARNVIPDFPDQLFATVDFAVEDMPNVFSSLFAVNEGSFLAGAAAAMFTQMTEIEGVNEQNIIGWISGIETPLINDFFGGFEQGARYIDPDIQILQAFAGSFTDPLRGRELALAQIEQGADIIMNVASLTGLGVLEAAAQEGRFAIGVDLNQDDLYPGHILTSMLKNVDVAIYMFVESILEDTFRGGETLYFDLSSYAVGLTDFSVFRSIWGDEPVQEIIDRVDELSQRIRSGEIEVVEFPGVRGGNLVRR